MNLKVALYAEGPAEDRGEEAWQPEVGADLPDDLLGPAHRLVARLVSELRGMPPAAVRFVGPVLRRNLRHSGSDLLSPKVLRRLLAFPDSTKRPVLAVVLVDEDGDENRRRRIAEGLADHDLAHVVAVAVREFESWLIADQSALAQLLGVTETPPSPESMAPGRAKELLQNWISQAIHSTPSAADRATRVRELRVSLAERCDLRTLDRLSSFQHFRDDLRNILQRIA